MEVAASSAHARGRVLPMPMVGSCPCPWPALPMPVVGCCPCTWSVLPVPVVGAAVPVVGSCPCLWSGPGPWSGAARAHGRVLPVAVVRFCPWSSSTRCLANDRQCQVLDIGQDLPLARCLLGLVIQVCLGQAPSAFVAHGTHTGLWDSIDPRAEVWWAEELYVTFCQALAPTLHRVLQELG